MSYDLQNFYKSTLLLDWSIGTGNFYVTAKPTVSTGWLVISPNNTSLREIVKFTATGTDANGDYVTVSVRGVGGTTEQTHTQGEPIRMNITAEYWDDMNQEIADIVAAGAVNANTTTKGGVEIATNAEVIAGTDSGGTGASLVATPSQINTRIDTKISEITPTLAKEVKMRDRVFVYGGTFAANTPTGTTVLTHSLGVLPSFVRFSAQKVSLSATSKIVAHGTASISDAGAITYKSAESQYGSSNSYAEEGYNTSYLAKFSYAGFGNQTITLSTPTTTQLTIVNTLSGTEDGSTFSYLIEIYY